MSSHSYTKYHSGDIRAFDPVDYIFESGSVYIMKFSFAKLINKSNKKKKHLSSRKLLYMYVHSIHGDQKITSWRGKWHKGGYYMLIWKYWHMCFVLS